MITAYVSRTDINISAMCLKRNGMTEDHLSTYLGHNIVSAAMTIFFQHFLNKNLRILSYAPFALSYHSANDTVLWNKQYNGTNLLFTTRKAMMRTIPSSPKPIIFTATNATSQVTSNTVANPSRRHRGGGSLPSVGLRPSADSQMMAERFNSRLHHK